MLFSLEKTGLVFGIDVITKLNLTLVRSELYSFFLVNRMCTFQNSISHLQHDNVR